MKNKYKLLTYCRNTRIEKKAVALGYASMIMFMCPRSSKFQMQTLNFWLTPAIDHKQIMFFFDSAASPVGYVTWAHLAPDVEKRLLDDQCFFLNPSEWNEGGNTWIIDFCFPRGGVKEATTLLKDIFLDVGVDQVFWARRNNDYSLRKTLRCKLSPCEQEE
ncbi:toxin-activating lysine-acyltransferase [Pseudomonas syringae group genomosp. 3]|uniref:toxin-activating lysine-acyltransferase n=1 Tax=Pseudomonas syringae group genomosp. 3 TaxID=251701 RepID=UPI000F00D69A|nr:toxin-activating lysine-acyltransferase [Pseudomonas syringae group genomosp. 3]